MIQMMPPSKTQPMVGLLPMLLVLNRKNTYWLATWARLAITMMSAATIAQPPHQPVLGPNALVAHVNVVPQSGSALFISEYPIEVSSIGMNARIATIGDWSPTARTTNTSVAAMLYAGATDAVAITVLEIRPSAPDLSPFSTGCSVGRTFPAVAMTTPPLLARPAEAGAGITATLPVYG